MIPVGQVKTRLFRKIPPKPRKVHGTNYAALMSAAPLDNKARHTTGKRR